MICLPEAGSNRLIQGRDDKSNVEGRPSKLIRETATGRAPRNRLVGLVPMGVIKT